MAESDDSAQSSRFRGLAIFAGFGFAAGFGLIFALERVGAPDQLVAALGPLLAIATLAVIGAAARAPNILDFLAARRSTPAIYAGLAFAAVAVGMFFCLVGETAEPQAAPWRGVVVGLIIAALFGGPRWRFENASALTDVLASYYSSSVVRALLALAVAAAGIATGVAGLELASRTLQATLGVGQTSAIAVCALALAISVAPGGFKSSIWTDAASGGGLLLVLALAAALSFHDPAEPAARISAFAEAAKSSSGAGFAVEIAAALATAAFFAFAPSALAVASTSLSARAGALGLLFLLIAAGGYALSVGAPVGRPSQRAMAATIAWLPAMAIARAGVLAISRATGLDLASARARLAVLASGRIALSRASALVAIGVCGFLSLRESASPDRALYAALSIGLAFIAPSLVLTLIPGRSNRSALAALGTAALVAAMYAAISGGPANGSDWLAAALVAGGLGLIAGLGAILAYGQPSQVKQPRSDPFLDLPLDLDEVRLAPAGSRAPIDADERRPPR